MMSGSVTIADNAQVAFQGNHAKLNGGAITSRQHVTIAGPGSVQFISYSPSQGGAIASSGDCVIFSSQNVTSVQFISNSPIVKEVLLLLVVIVSFSPVRNCSKLSAVYQQQCWGWGKRD